MFSRDLKVYAYPWHDNENDVLIRTDNAPIHPRIKPLYDYLLFNKRISDIQLEDLSLLDIFSVEVLRMIREGKGGWEEMVPHPVDHIIKRNRLFGYNGPAPVDPGLADAALLN